MMRNLRLLAVALLVFVASCGSGSTDAPSTSSSSGPRAAATSTTSTGPASALVTVLTRALVEEHHAASTYANVIARLGAAGPFPKVAASEQTHIEVLERLAAEHGVALPLGPFAGDVAPPTLPEACRQGVAIEEADVALYDELLPQVPDQADVAKVLTTLRTASLENHLPAFEQCADPGPADGRAGGPG